MRKDKRLNYYEKTKNWIVPLVAMFVIFLIAIPATAAESEIGRAEKTDIVSFSNTAVTEIRPVLKTPKLVKNGVQLSWSAVNGVDRYRVYRKTSVNGSWKKLYETTSTSMINISVESGKNYRYYVQCLDKNKKLIGSKSNEIDVTYVARPVIASLTNTKRGVTIKWGAVEGASKYRVYRKKPSSSGWNKIYDTSSTSMINIKVESGTQYRYAVCCLDSAGNLLNVKSEEKAITYIARPEITSVSNEKNGIMIKWNSVKGASKYRVYRKTSGDTAWRKVTDTVKTSAVNVKVEPGKEYVYSVRCIDGSGILCNTYSESKNLVRKVKAYTRVPHSRLHIERNSESESIQVPYMTEMTLLESYPGSANGNWLRVAYQGKEYYAWQYAGNDMLTTEKSMYSYDTSTIIQKELLELALSFLDKPTRYTQSSLGEADEDGVIQFDCSGFATFVTRKTLAKYNPIYYVTSNVNDLYTVESIYNKGYPGEFNAITVIPQGDDLNLSLLQPGDLIFFNQKKEASRVVDHVGMYLGKGEFIQATKVYTDLQKTVCVMPLRDDYANDFVGAIRIIPEEVTPAMVEVYAAYDNTKIYSTTDCDESIAIVESQTPMMLLYTNSKFAYVQYKDMRGYVVLDRITTSIEKVEEIRYVAKTNGIKLYTTRNTAGDFINVPYGEEIVFNGRYQTYYNDTTPSNFYKVTYCNTRYYVYTTDDVNTILNVDKPLIVHETRYVIKTSLKLYVTDATNVDYVTVQSGEELVYKGLYRETHETPIGRFYLVEYQGKEYYIYTREEIDLFLSLEKPVQVSEKRYVVNTSIKLYVEDATTSDSITLLLGDELLYKGLYRETHETPTGRFYLVYYEGQDYYIYTKAEIDELLLPDYGEVMCVKSTATVHTAVWLRSTMDTSTNDNKIARVYEGDVLEIIQISSGGSWAAVKTENGYAFTLTKYLSL